MKDVMPVISKVENNIQTLQLNGRMTYDFIDQYEKHIKKGIVNADGYIIDLRAIEQIDSTGLGLLVTLAKYFMNNKGKMVIVNTDALIHELFVVSKLDQIFKISDSIVESIKIIEDKDEVFWTGI